MFKDTKKQRQNINTQQRDKQQANNGIKKLIKYGSNDEGRRTKKQRNRGRQTGRQAGRQTVLCPQFEAHLEMSFVSSFGDCAHEVIISGCVWRLVCCRFVAMLSWMKTCRNEFHWFPNNYNDDNSQYFYLELGSRAHNRFVFSALVVALLENAPQLFVLTDLALITGIFFDSSDAAPGIWSVMSHPNCKMLLRPGSQHTNTLLQTLASLQKLLLSWPLLNYSDWLALSYVYMLTEVLVY